MDGRAVRAGELGTMSRMDERIRTVLTTSRGAVSARHLHSRGLSRGEVERAVGRGDLVRVRRNALVDGQLWREAAAWERHALRARAVAAGFDRGRPTALSHHSALAVRGVSLHGVDERVHVSRVGAGRGRTDGVLASHRPVQESLTEVHEGLLLVRPAVACLQVAAQFGAEAALVSADDALHRGVLTPEDLTRALRELAPGRWSRAPAEMVALADPRVESAAESRARWVFHVLGFRQPTPQVVIRDEAGGFVARVDFLYEDLGLVIEVDGMGKYAEAGDLRAEKLREDRLRELGHHVVRLTWGDLADPLVVRQKVLQGVARAA